MTPYQLAIMLVERYPDLQALGPVGGAGVGQRNTFAQYLAGQLSAKIKANGDSYPIEGALLSGRHAREISYEEHGGEPVVSSLTGSGFDLTLFRLREPR